MAGGLTLAGSFEGGCINEDVDWAVTWDVDQGRDGILILQRHEAGVAK